jgi:hypothetical protein
MGWTTEVAEATTKIIAANINRVLNLGVVPITLVR